MTLSERYWRASISVPGGFIASDNPVVMDGPKGQLVAFKNAEIVLFPVSRHVLLLSATRKVKPLPATYNRVAAINTFMMMTADEQVYSHTPNFYWLDENGNPKPIGDCPRKTGLWIARYPESWSSQSSSRVKGRADRSNR